MAEERQCPDEGTCHHECAAGCWRVFNCGPLSAAHYPNDAWPAEVRAAELERELRVALEEPISEERMARSLLAAVAGVPDDVEHVRVDRVLIGTDDIMHVAGAVRLPTPLTYIEVKFTEGRQIDA